MKCFIWQQFSSNHSSNFTVAGTFATPEEAAHAATTIRQFLETLYAWEMEHGDDGRRNNASPQHEFARRYDISQYIDEQSSLIAEDVLQWERLVFVYDSNTWDMPTAYYHLLERLGSVETVVGWDIEEHLRLWLACTAPDEATATHITDAVHAYLATHNAPFGPVPRPANAETTEGGWREQAQALLRQFLPLPTMPVQRAPCPWGSAIVDEVADGDESSTVLRDGQRIRFDLRFWHIAEGTRALVRYLEAQGCTGFEYYIKAEGDSEFAAW
jgi:hypothetical protein